MRLVEILEKEERKRIERIESNIEQQHFVARWTDRSIGRNKKSIDDDNNGGPNHRG